MPPSDAEVAESLRAILASPEFQQPAWHKILLRLGELGRQFLGWLAALGPIARIAVILGCLAILAAMVIHLWSMYRRILSPADTVAAGKLSTSVPTHLSPDLLVERAHALAAAGRLRDAARALQQALLLDLCQRRGVSWRDTLADWEWMRIFGAQPALVDFTRRTQRLAFGASPDRAQFDSCAAELDRLRAHDGREAA